MRPKLSVLVPSRGRVEALRYSLASFGWQESKRLPLIEFLIAIDADDPQLEDYRHIFGDSTALIVCPRYGYGYQDEYLNVLAKLSKGNWLLSWNDDAQMGVCDWMTPLLSAPIDSPHTAQFANYDYLPMMNRKMYEIIGHFSKGGLIDRYILGLGNKAGVHLYLGTPQNISLTHDRIDDQSKRDSALTEGIAAERDGLGEQEKAVEKVKAWKGKHETTKG